MRHGKVYTCILSIQQTKITGYIKEVNISFCKTQVPEQASEQLTPQKTKARIRAF
jgi:hypothetical protein